MSWRAGKIFTRATRKGRRIRGRYYYWNGNKRNRVFRSMEQGMPTHRPRTRR